MQNLSRSSPVSQNLHKFKKLINQCIVKRNPFFIHFSKTIRQHPGPVNGKAISFQPQFFHMFHIFFKSVIMIAGYVSCMSLIDSSIIPPIIVTYWSCVHYTEQ